MRKYYWVLFRVIRNSWDAKGISKGVEEMHVEELADIHPILLMNERNEKYGKEHDDSPPFGHKARENYGLLNWKEISQEEYEEFSDIL